MRKEKLKTDSIAAYRALLALPIVEKGEAVKLAIYALEDIIADATDRTSAEVFDTFGGTHGAT